MIRDKLKRVLCFFGLHWSVTTGRFAMGDGKSCDVCHKETYGWMLHVNSRPLEKLEAEEGWKRNERILREFIEAYRNAPPSEWSVFGPDRSKITHKLDLHPTIKCMWGERCQYDYKEWKPMEPRNAIWLENMRYPVCRHCFVESPYE